MNTEIVFYYVIYSNPPYEKNNPFWKNFILSLSTLRFFYPKNKVTLIVYANEKIPPIIQRFSTKMNYEIVEEHPVYDKLDNLRLNYKMFSRHLNCYNNALKNKEKIIYLDSDIFLLKPFTNTRWDRVGIYNDGVSQVNGGLIYMDSDSIAANKFVNFIKSEVKDILENKYDKMNYIKKAYPNCGDHCSIQEETMFRNLIQRDRNQFLEIFYNFGYENNGTVNLNNIKDKNLFSKLNNIHLIVEPPENIIKSISLINCFNDILSSNRYIGEIIPNFVSKNKLNIALKFI
jgi:hypothetical protein